MSNRYDVPANKYSHTPRGIFEKFVDKANRREQKTRQDFREVQRRLHRLEEILTQLFPIEDEVEEQNLQALSVAIMGDDAPTPAERRAAKRKLRG